MDVFKRNSSSLFHLKDWARTIEGTPIELYSSEPLDELSEGKATLIVGGIHGDEPEGVWLAEEILEKVMRFQHRINRPWVLIPCLNVDGFSKKQRTNSNGVDLNRNFPTDDWTPQAKEPRYNPGKAPSSELEVQALVKLIEDKKFQLILHLHSWNPCIVYTSDKAPLEAKILSEETGYELRETIGYHAPGSLGDWGWYKLKTPVICVEAQEKSNRNSVWKIFESGFSKVLGWNE